MLDYLSWDNILITADYKFVYFDGLNRFYVAKEHSELDVSFSCPPNVFDNFVLCGIVERDTVISSLETELNSTKTDLISNQIMFNSTEVELDETKEQLDSIGFELNSKIDELLGIYRSRGWKMVVLIRRILNTLAPLGSTRRKVIKSSCIFFRVPIKILLKIVQKIKHTFSPH